MDRLVIKILKFNKIERENSKGKIIWIERLKLLNTYQTKEIYMR